MIGVRGDVPTLIMDIDYFHQRVHLNLSWDDVRYVLGMASYLVPGQRMAFESGKAIFEKMAQGVNSKGREWANSHLFHRDNCMETIRHRVDKWLIGNNGIDVGCGLVKVRPECVGVDNGDDFMHDSEADDFRDITDLTGYEDGQFDWLFSSNSIEHVANWQKALDEWVRVVRSGGIVYLYTPWPERFPVLRAGGPVKGHLWNPTPEIIGRALIERGCEIVECDDDVDDYGTFVIVGRKR